MVEHVVVAKHVSRSFMSGDQTVNAVDDVTCTVRPGDRIALMGPSGSGKSTLLHLLGGLDSPTAGTVTWPLFGPTQSLRPLNVVHVFQGPSLLPPLTVIENVCLPLLLAGMDDVEASACATQSLDAFGVLPLQDKLPEEISGGQSQRVAIARAMAGRPKLILADEPTGQLDSATAILVLDQLVRMAEEFGSAIVLSTHDPLIADHLNVLWTMTNGRVQIVDSAGETPQDQASRVTTPA